MSQTQNVVESQSSRDAINRVLEAERRMADALDECRKRAAGIIEDARRRARSIAKRTDRRIRLLHERCDKAADARIKTIESSFDEKAGIDHIDSRDDEYMQAAVHELAKALTTAERDGPGT